MGFPFNKQQGRWDFHLINYTPERPALIQPTTAGFRKPLYNPPLQSLNSPITTHHCRVQTALIQPTTAGFRQP